MSTWQAVNTWITFILAIVVVLVLAVTLIATLAWLMTGRRAAEQLASGLETVSDQTESVPRQLPTINGAMVQLRDGLESVDGHLGGAAGAFGLR
jgi:hypothetical protein